MPRQRLYLRGQPQGQGSLRPRPFPAGPPAGGGRRPFVSQWLRFFQHRVEFCRFGELPVLFEHGEGGFQANRWRSVGVGEDFLNVGQSLGG